MSSKLHRSLCTYLNYSITMASSSSLLIKFPNLQTLLLLIIAFGLIGVVRSDFAADRTECTNQLVGLASCLAFVQQIDIQAPTPDCCDDFSKVVKNSFKCLCVLIKDRDEPQLGIKVNVTRALILPAKCNAPANVSDCPRLLKLPLDSSQAKDFKQFSDEMEGKGKSAEGKSNSTLANASIDTSKQSGGSNNINGAKGMKLLQMEKRSGTVCILVLLSILSCLLLKI